MHAKTTRAAAFQVLPAAIELKIFFQARLSCRSPMDNGGTQQNGVQKVGDVKNRNNQIPEKPSIRHIIAIITERDAAVLERNLAQSEKRVALAERDMAIHMRDAAFAERDKAIEERNQVLQMLESAAASDIDAKQADTNAKQSDTDDK
ncbi:hypothetical protein QQ045_013748 [Rhodiola kirilowii]